MRPESESMPRTSTRPRRATPPLAARISTRLVDVVVGKYAPLPAASLSNLVRRLRYAAPQWTGQLDGALAARQAATRPRAGRRRGLVLAGGRDHHRSPSRATRCGCSRRSIRSSGIAGGSRSSGAGPIASRRTRPCRSASWGITRCRCSGATVSSAGRTSRPPAAAASSDFGYVASRPPRGRGFRRALERGTGSPSRLSRFAVTSDLMYAARHTTVSSDGDHHETRSTHSCLRRPRAVCRRCLRAGRAGFQQS